MDKNVWNPDVLVCSGCFEQKYHRLSGLNNKRLFLTGLKAGKPNVNMLADSVAGKGRLLTLQKAIFLVYPHMVESGERSTFLVSPLIMALIPSRGLHLHDRSLPESTTCTQIHAFGETQTRAKSKPSRPPALASAYLCTIRACCHTSPSGRIHTHFTVLDKT